MSQPFLALKRVRDTLAANSAFTMTDATRVDLVAAIDELDDEMVKAEREHQAECDRLAALPGRPMSVTLADEQAAFYERAFHNKQGLEIAS